MRQLEVQGPTWRAPSVAEVLRSLPFFHHLPQAIFDALLEHGCLLGGWARLGIGLATRKRVGWAEHLRTDCASISQPINQMWRACVPLSLAALMHSQAAIPQAHRPNSLFRAFIFPYALPGILAPAALSSPAEFSRGEPIWSGAMPPPGAPPRHPQPPGREPTGNGGAGGGHPAHHSSKQNLGLYIVIFGLVRSSFTDHRWVPLESTGAAARVGASQTTAGCGQGRSVLRSQGLWGELGHRFPKGVETTGSMAMRDPWVQLGSQTPEVLRPQGSCSPVIDGPQHAGATFCRGPPTDFFPPFATLCRGSPRHSFTGPRRHKTLNPEP